MADLVLLAVETDLVRVEIKGPRSHRLGSLGNPPANGAVKALGAGLRSVTTEIERDVWVDLTVPGSSDPLFFEDTRYRMSVATRSGSAPTLRVRDSALLREVEAFPDQGLLAGSFNFGRQVGTATFDVDADGETLRISVEVFPTKLDYATDYQDVLHDIASASRALGLEYLRSTQRRGDADDVAGRNADVEWLTLVRQEVDLLDSAMAYLDAHPHRALVASTASVRVDRIRRVDASSRRAVLRGQGQGPWVAVAGIGKVRSRLPTSRREETLDTAEHRWLAQALRVVTDRLGEVHSGLVVEIQDALARGSNATRLIAEAGEVEEFVTRISRMRRLPVLQDVTGLPPAGFTSLTLLSAPGYSDAYRALTTLRLGLHIEGDAFDLSLKELSALYEAWCFIRVASRLMHRVTAWDASDAIAVTERGLRVNLVQGRMSSLRLLHPARTVTLSYNPIYPGLTGDQRPDIVIEIRHERWPAMFIVLDAKYRLSADSAYLERFDIPGPPTDAINALHRYRDAIAVAEGGTALGRPVVVGAALYPLDRAAAKNWPTSRLCQALTTLGIGAIPYLPSNTDFLDAWLDFLMGLPPRELARPGPPFMAWEAVLAGHQ